nr:hypothetical protein [Tanacetum cinerariifolium]
MQTNQFAGSVSSILGIVQRYMDQRMNEAVKDNDNQDDDDQDEGDDDDDQDEGNNDDQDTDEDGEEFIHPNEEGQDADDDEDKLYRDVNINLEGRVSSSVSSQFVTSMLNPTPDAGIDSLFETTSQMDVPAPTTMASLTLSAPTLTPSTILSHLLPCISYYLYVMEMIWLSCGIKSQDWNNPKGQQYPHNLLKPLPLILNSRGRRVISFDHFINNDLEYLRRGASSRKYTTSVTKTKAADNGHIKWIEDLVPRTMWSQEPFFSIYFSSLIFVCLDVLCDGEMIMLSSGIKSQAGSESRPPMLNKENYVPWSSRLLRYAKSRPNGKLIHNSILNGPYVRQMIPEPGDANREDTTILLGFPKDIYAAVNSCETAQEIWLRVQQMMKGSDIGM